MRWIPLLLLAGVGLAPPADPWRTDVAEAFDVARKSQRPLFAVVLCLH